MFARTDRLLLRPGWREDAAALHAAIADPAIIDKLPGAPWPYGVADAEAFVAQDRADGALPQLLAYVRTRAVPRLVGGVALRDAGRGEAELDYWITRRCWGLGYATEAARAVIAMARPLGIARLRSGRFVDNPASGRVLAKLGFRETGDVDRRWSAVRGRTVDCVLYAMAA